MSILELKIAFELSNFKVLNPIMFVTIGENNELLLRSKRDFKDVYQNLVYSKLKEDTGSIASVSFIDSWLVDPSMRTYYKLDFLPREIALANIFNTFTGFEAEKKELFPVDIEETLLMKHIKKICGNSNEVVQFFLNWLANMVQHPLLL